MNSYAAYWASAETSVVTNKEAPCWITALSFPSKWGTSTTATSKAPLVFMCANPAEEPW